MNQDSEQLLKALGRGWPAMENLLRIEIKRVFASDEPKGIHGFVEDEHQALTEAYHKVTEAQHVLRKYLPSSP
jgi:hypothetical protein